jgi:glycosyltransferase involved in cell wall biosynthesis
LDLDDDVLFLGHRNDPYEILALMDVFVMPSMNEGIPMVLLEALALSRPVVASRVGGIPEVIEHGASGLLVDAGQHEALAHACITLLDDRERAERLGVAGRKRIEQEFSADTMTAKVAELYRALVWNEDADDWACRSWTDRAGAPPFCSVGRDARNRRCADDAPSRQWPL